MQDITRNKLTWRIRKSPSPCLSVLGWWRLAKSLSIWWLDERSTVVVVVVEAVGKAFHSQYFFVPLLDCFGVLPLLRKYHHLLLPRLLLQLPLQLYCFLEASQNWFVSICLRLSVCVCVCVSLSSITCAQTHTHTLKHFYIAGGMQQSVTAYWTYNYLSLAHSITHGMQSRDVWQKYVHTRNAQATHIVDWCICWSTHTHTQSFGRKPKTLL